MTTPTEYRPNRKVPERLPLFPLPGALLLPGGQLPLNIFEPRYLRMVDDALGQARMIGMIQPRDASGLASGSSSPHLYSVGCAGRISSFSETDDGRYLINLTGVSRFRLANELHSDTPYRLGEIDIDAFRGDEAQDDSADLVDRERLEAAMRHYLDAEGLKTDWDAVSDAPTAALIASLAMGCPFAPNEKQALLEAENAAMRAECLIALMEMAQGDGADTTNLQ